MYPAEQQQGELQSFRLLLALPRSQRVLVSNHVPSRLPRIATPKWTRTAHYLTKMLQEKWGYSFILIDFLADSETVEPVAVVEVRSEEWDFRSAGFISVEASSSQPDLTPHEQSTICKIVAGDINGRGPFSRTGWIDDAQYWIRQSLRQPQLIFSDDIQQFHAGSSLSLGRFQSDSGTAYWLKAVGYPNTHELKVTQTLACLCPELLPPFIAAREDWNAWVTEEVGQPLESNFGRFELERSVRCLADLQIATTAHLDTLLDAGCFDLRTTGLRRHLPSLIEYLASAMTRQTSNRVPPMPSDRLDALGLLLKKATIKLEMLCIPDAIVHNDINSGNILLDNSRVVFIDWSEACIGNPFFTFQNLLAYASESDEFGSWGPNITQIYVERWSSILSRDQIELAIILSRPLAIASYLLGRDPSFDAPFRQMEHVQSYARSLARTMDRFAKAPDFLEALCN